MCQQANKTKGDYYVTKLDLLRSKMAAAGYKNFTSDLMKLLGISWTTASQKMNGKSDFTQKEITILTLKLGLSANDVKEIFVGDE